MVEIVVVRAGGDDQGVERHRVVLALTRAWTHPDEVSIEVDVGDLGEENADVVAPAKDTT